MKLKAIFFALSLGLTSLSCKEITEPNENKPAIKAISFIGIPDKNVVFDAPNSRIRVQLPAVLEGGLQPVFHLTDGTRVIDGVMADNTIDLTPFCACNLSGEARKVIVRVGKQNETSIYELIVVATGSLKAQASTDQLTFSRKTKQLDLSLPVENLYSSPAVSMLMFTNLATGNVTHVSADGVCLNRCASTVPNHLKFSLGSPIENDLLPGSYRISLNGIDFPQRLVVVD